MKAKRIISGIFLCTALLANAAAAADSSKAGTGGGSNDGTLQWGGLGWGIGVATNFDFEGKRVNKASVVNNIVRVDDVSSNVSVGLVLEAHYFLSDSVLTNFHFTPSCAPGGWCTDMRQGPFVAIEVASLTAGFDPKSSVTSYALGWMVGLKHVADQKGGVNSSWNLGLGLRITPGAQVLGDGIVANQTLPPGESSTNVRLKTEPRLGVMLLSSFSF